MGTCAKIIPIVELVPVDILVVSVVPIDSVPDVETGVVVVEDVLLGSGRVKITIPKQATN